MSRDYDEAKERMRRSDFTMINILTRARNESGKYLKQTATVSRSFSVRSPSSLPQLQIVAVDDVSGRKFSLTWENLSSPIVFPWPCWSQAVVTRSETLAVSAPPKEGLFWSLACPEVDLNKFSEISSCTRETHEPSVWTKTHVFLRGSAQIRFRSGFMHLEDLKETICREIDIKPVSVCAVCLCKEFSFMQEI